MEFALHPDPTMGIFLQLSENPLYANIMFEWVFPLTDDERSQAYIAWRDSQP